MGRDYLNKGHRVQDRNVASGSVPEADPSLATDGTALPVDISGVRVSGPYILVVCDLAGGSSPEAQLEFWGYFDPPTASPALSSDWQHLDTVDVSDVVGLKPSMALFPLVGLNRYSVLIKTVTGAPTSVRMREIVISEETAQALLMSGLVASGGSIGITVTPNLLAADALPTAVSNGDDVRELADLYGRAMSAAHDLINVADRTNRENPEWGQKEGRTLIDETNLTDATYARYFSPEDFGKFAIDYHIHPGAGGTGVVVTIWTTTQDDGTAMDSCDYIDNSTAFLGAANITVAGGAGLTSGTINDYAGQAHCYKYIKVQIVCDSTPNNECDVTMYLRQGY